MPDTIIVDIQAFPVCHIVCEDYAHETIDGMMPALKRAAEIWQEHGCAANVSIYECEAGQSIAIKAITFHRQDV